MAIDVPPLLAFNRGVISRKALARVDVGRVALSAEAQTNWQPRVLGSMTIRPGRKYIGATAFNNKARFLPFVYAIDDTAKIELTSQTLRIWDGETEELVTRPTVTATIANSSFTSDLTSWTDADEAGATSEWVAGGYLGLTGTGFSSAIRRQLVVCNNFGVTHAIRVSVTQGPVVIRIGTTAGSDDLMPATTLRTGTHSLTFLPGTDFYVEFSASRLYRALIASAEIEAAGVLTLPTEWTLTDLPYIRWDRSADVVFVACLGYRPRRIERFGEESWSIVVYEPETGPFQVENTGPISIAPSALTGNVTLTASSALFSSFDVGQLYQLTSFGQAVAATFTGEDQWSDPVRVTGTGASQRTLTHVLGDLSGTGTTVTLQRSVGSPGAWVDISTFTTNGTRNYNDGLDNQIMYYRLGVGSGDYSTGTITLDLTYASSGSITGTARITGYNSATEVTAIVYQPFGGTDATTTWAAGEWSAVRGYPTAVAFFQGRLWWFGNGRVEGSVSDQFDNFDAATEGDSGPILRSIGGGVTEVINWCLPLSRLLFGGQMATWEIKSSSIEEPVTPTAFGINGVSTQGTAAVEAMKVDNAGYYVQRNNTRLYSIAQQDARFDFTDGDLMTLAPEIGEPGIIRVGVQRQPDTRLHCVRSDGKVALMVVDRAEEVSCWVLVEDADGEIEDVVVLPGDSEDRVYYVVKRTVNAATVRYLERVATEAEAWDGTDARLMDSYGEYSGAAAVTIPAAHLEGKQVVVWAGGSVDDANGDPKLFAVSGGSFELDAPVTSCVYGLPYTADFKSSKLAYAAQVGTSLTMKKKIDRLGVVMADTHARGLKYGPDFDNLDNLPAVENGTATAAQQMWTDYDQDTFSFPGVWDTDARMCLRAASPRPCTLLAAVLVLEGHRKF
ncbi:MAG TPA: hypothetical protein PKI99_00670 [Terrimesophilobacter sp.]|nr:hypothetical protein [Terrimesophilobacter sp.]